MPRPTRGNSGPKGRDSGTSSSSRTSTSIEALEEHIEKLTREQTGREEEEEQVDGWRDDYVCALHLVDDHDDRRLEIISSDHHTFASSFTTLPSSTPFCRTPSPTASRLPRPSGLLALNMLEV